MYRRPSKRRRGPPPSGGAGLSGSRGGPGDAPRQGAGSGDRKVGGILLEVAGEQDKVDWVVVGIGINVNTEYSELPVALRRTATSLKMAGGEPVDRSELLARLLLALDAHYAEAVADGLEGALDGFRRRDYLLSTGVSVQTREGPVAGRAAGIDERGALLVELPQRQIRRFHCGDVTLRL